MKYLLDTCVLLWSLEGNTKRLGDFAEIITDQKNLIFVSVASYWEITIKRTLGRITFEENLQRYIEDSGFIWLNIETSHIDHLLTLPLIHNDPFDRLLVAQSKVNNLKILTADEKVFGYL